MTSDDQEPKTPAEYFQNGRKWLDLAEWENIDNKSFDRSANLAILAMASALLALCAQFIREQGDD
jgi:hypothetical protein